VANASETPMEETTSDFGQATSEAISKITEGDFAHLSEYASSHLIPAVLLAGMGLGVIFLGYLVASYVSRAISRPICRRVDETLGRFVGKVFFYCILLGVVAAVLSKLGAPLGGLAAMLAAAGFAVGLAFQGTLSNFASGVLMLVFRPFKVGDVINAGGVTGKVNEIDLFTVTLDTPDNRRIIVPNSAIASGTIENISFHDQRRVEARFADAQRRTNRPTSSTNATKTQTWQTTSGAKNGRDESAQKRRCAAHASRCRCVGENAHTNANQVDASRSRRRCRRCRSARSRSLTTRLLRLRGRGASPPSPTPPL